MTWTSCNSISHLLNITTLRSRFSDRSIPGNPPSCGPTWNSMSAADKEATLCVASRTHRSIFPVSSHFLLPNSRSSLAGNWKAPLFSGEPRMISSSALPDSTKQSLSNVPRFLRFPVKHLQDKLQFSLITTQFLDLQIDNGLANCTSQYSSTWLLQLVLKLRQRSNFKQFRKAGLQLCVRECFI